MEKTYQTTLYSIFRIVVGLLFFVHGGQKLFGWFGGNQAELFSLIGLAGIIEFFGGILIAVGLFTQVAAVFAALCMGYAYLFVHAAKGGFLPSANGGELALLYFVSFLVLIAYGAGPFSLDAKWRKK